MDTMDVDILDGPSEAPTRTTRFAPRGASKFRPKPKAEPPVTTSSSSIVSDTVPLPKKEELETKPPVILNDENNELDDAREMEVEAKAEDVIDEPVDMESGGEDEVVREIDVYFTPSVDPNTQLYVLQYPLRPLWRPYELEDRCEEVRVKPETAEVEVDLSVDESSKNYDRSADPRMQMKKQILSTSWKPPATTGYAVGLLTGNKLHLSPVHAVVQLRPSMEHLNPSEQKKKSSAAANVENKIKLEEEKVVGSSKRQGKPSASVNDQSKDTDKDWIPLKYHGPRSDIATAYLQKMVAVKGSPIQFSLSSQDYLNTLCPGTLNESNKSMVPPRRFRFLLSLSLEERIKTWLLEGPPIHRFNALKHLAPDEPIEDILGVLQKYAQIVQGLWVPKSSLLYGIDQGMEALARDYILLLFSKNPIISNLQLPQKPQLLRAMKDVLNVLAVERPSFSDWKFKEPPDLQFAKNYPNIIKEQEQAWEHLDKKISDGVFGGRNRPGMKDSSKPSISSHAPEKTSNKLMTRTSTGAPSRMSMSEETREALPRALQKLLQIHKVCSFQQICQRLREMAVSESSRPKGDAREAIAAADGVNAPPEELHAIISQVAINIHGVYVLKSSPDHPQYDALRKIVIDLLVAEGPSAKLKRASIAEAAKLQLKRDFTNIEYQKVLQELCVSQGSAWVLKSGDGNPK